MIKRTFLILAVASFITTAIVWLTSLSAKHSIQLFSLVVTLVGLGFVASDLHKASKALDRAADILEKTK